MILNGFISLDRVIPVIVWYDSMKYLVLLLFLFPLSVCYAVSATPNSVITFYVTDPNLVTNHRGVMTLSTAGLVDFTIDGVQIPGPGSMVETGIDTGVFQLSLTIPSSVNGKPIQNGDVVVMTYHQPSDNSGNPQTLTQSVVLNSIPTTAVEPSGSMQSANIGQYYTLQLYAPNYNLDSQVPDDIPLSLVQVHMGGLSTTLADNAFDIGNGVLRETGRNTDVFAATFKIPREIDGIPVDIGSTLEFRVIDNSQPMQAESSIFLTIGTHFQANGGTVPRSIPPRNISVQTPSTYGAPVNFLNSTVLEGLVGAVCFPSSGSFFPIGTTTVTCSASNSEGTSVLRSFTVTVTHVRSLIPSWVRNLAGFWCDNAIQDKDFKAAIQFLDSSKIISVPSLQNQTLPIDKTGICAWSNGNSTDEQVLRLFLPLIR